MTTIRQPLVDLHSHVLPEIDDGAKDDDTALDMLRAAASDGIEIIAATPHAHYIDTPERVERDLDRLSGLAVSAGIEISVIPGSEVRIGHDLVERYHDGQLVTLNNTSYLLLELFLGHELSQETVETTVDNLLHAGLTPILAHPERYQAIQRYPESLHGLVTRGIPIQINAGSLTGYHGAAARVAAEALVKKRLVHIIASDAHNASSRPPAIRSALNHVAELTDPDYAGWIADTAATVARGSRVILPEPLPSA